MNTLISFLQEAHANTEGDLEDFGGPKYGSGMNPNRKIGTLALKPHLPYIKLNIPLSITSN